MRIGGVVDLYGLVIIGDHLEDSEACRILIKRLVAGFEFYG